jgi:hypothetical protein
MKFTTDCPYADPEAAARKLIEIANSVEAPRSDQIRPLGSFPLNFSTFDELTIRA